MDQRASRHENMAFLVDEAGRPAQDGTRESESARRAKSLPEVVKVGVGQINWASEIRYRIVDRLN